MERLVRTFELIVYTFVFLVCMVLALLGDAVFDIDDTGRSIMILIGIVAGVLMLDTIIIRRLQAKEELKRTIDGNL